MRYLIRRRVAAGLCAVALIAALVAFPVRARAAAALPVVGYAVTISAFLAACGIYPFQDENGQSFGEWGARKLTELWDTYVTEVYPQSEAAQAISDVKSFYANGGYITMARDTWSKLRSFAAWICERFGLQNNAEGVGLGDRVFRFPEITACGSSSEVQYFGALLGTFSDGSNFRVMKYSGYANVPVYAGAYSSGERFYFCLMSRDSGFGVWYFIRGVGSATSGRESLQGISFHSIRLGAYSVSVDAAVPVFDSQAQLQYAFLGLSSDGYRLAGTMADTATISIPDELPEGAEMGGLAVVGAGAGADALEGVIESGVMERQQPVVRPVEVEIGEGVEVDTETGAIAEELPSVITVTPESVPLTVSDYSIQGLSGLFPFSVPWDIARVWQALDAEPRWPLEDFVLSWDIPELWGDEPLVVRFRMEDMPQQVQDAVQGLARTVRAFLLIIACIGFLLFAVGFVKF